MHPPSSSWLPVFGFLHDDDDYGTDADTQTLLREYIDVMVYVHQNIYILVCAQMPNARACLAHTVEIKAMRYKQHRPTIIIRITSNLNQHTHVCCFPQIIAATNK